MFADPDVAKHTIARIEMRDEMVDGARQTRIVPGSFKVLLEYAVQREQCCHTGGGMAWDAAGNLYITVGNNTSNSGGSQTDERPGRTPWDDQRGAANTNDLRGKILRIHPEPDGTYTIPAGNLFPPGTPGTRPEIYTMGHRNPWRVSVDSRTGYVYWGEVGPDNGTDNPEVGPRGYEEFNQARRPGFFGWPFFVANNIPFPFRDYVNDKLLPAKDPNRPTNTSVNNTGLKELPPAMPAMIYYPSAVSDIFPEVGTGGRCAAGGPIYHRTDFAAAAPRPWPTYYEGKWLVTDCSRGWVISVTLDKRRQLPVDGAVPPVGALRRADGHEVRTGWRPVRARLRQHLVREERRLEARQDRVHGRQSHAEGRGVRGQGRRHRPGADHALRRGLDRLRRRRVALRMARAAGRRRRDADVPDRQPSRQLRSQRHLHRHALRDGRGGRRWIPRRSSS